MFYTHEDTHREPILEKLEKERIYKITFFFQTKRGVFYWTSRHVYT
jgi:hypothetical protein